MFGIILLVILLLALFVGTSSLKIVGQAEVMVVERLGKFNRIARSGLNILIPFVERPKAIDVRFFEADVNGVKKITAGSTSRMRWLIWSRLASVWSSSISPTMLRSVVRVSVSSA